MQKSSKILVGIVVVIAIVGIGVLIGSLGGSGSKPVPNVAPTPVESSSNKAQTGSAPVVHANTSLPRTGPVPPANFSATPVAAIVTNWEERLDQIIGSETDDTNKVNQLFDLFPNAPDEAKPEIAQHLSNLVGDEDYARLGELLKDTTLPDAALDILMSDALNRPNGIKLPELLDVAKTPNHPKADEAKDILALFLDEDYGQDWTKWQEKMTAWLKDNPD
jgi:hypothetical protein